MANLVIASNSKAMGKLEKSVKDKVWAFIEKLSQDHTAPGLHIEPLKGAVDPRVRTGRVDLNFRAILFKVDDKLGDDPTFIYMGTWPHDDANTLAEKSTLRVNPINGVLEGVVGHADTDSDHHAPTQSAKQKPATSAADNPKSFLAERFSLADLTDRLGLEPELAQRALAASSEDVLLDIAANAVGWQGSALLDLATGLHIDTIREKHGFAETPIDNSLDENEQILQALERPASKMQFTYVEDDDELRRIIEGGDIAAWRTFLHPEQRKYVEQNHSGPFRLSGGAGTGKTVVAVHRARRLGNAEPTARIVLTTYNRTLAADLKQSLRLLDPSVAIAERPGEPGVYVNGIDALGNAALKHSAPHIADASERVLGYRLTELTAQRTNSAKVWREVVHSVDSGLDGKLATPSFLDNEYVAVILANKVTTLAEYAKMPRPGRGVRLSRPQRIAIWKLVEAYRRQSRMDNSLSFPEVLALAAQSLKMRADAGHEFLADHVIVDEAQDLHATHWALLRAAVAESPNDLFIAEDSHQRIYGQPIVLSRFGIKIVGRSRRLTLNYRTTAQNLHFAVSILSGAEYHDLEQDDEESTSYRSARLGPNPVLIQCDSVADELEKVADQCKAWIGEGVEPGSIAVLTRGQNDRSQFVRALGEREVSARALDNTPGTPDHVQVLTMHRSKGMEFSCVILTGVDHAHVPSAATLRSVPEEEQAEALLRERSLLYVAASRARDELVVTWSGKQSDLLSTTSKATP